MAQLAGEAVRAAGVRSRAQAEPSARSADRSRLLLVLAVYALVGFFSFACVQQTSVIASMGYEVSRLESASAYTRLQNDQLRLQISEARSLERLEREAARLGLGPPESVVYLRAAPAALPVVEPGDPAPAPEPSWLDRLLGWLRGLW
jgi:hypothetical protein